jgi:hypothetical protein
MTWAEATITGGPKDPLQEIEAHLDKEDASMTSFFSDEAGTAANMPTKKYANDVVPEATIAGEPKDSPKEIEAPLDSNEGEDVVPSLLFSVAKKRISKAISKAIGSIFEAPSNRVTRVDLEKDIYSLFFIAKPWSSAFFFSILVVLFQYSLLFLIFYDLLEEDDHVAVRNRAKAPLTPNETDVKIAQYSAIVISLVSQEDVMKPFLLCVRYDPAIQATHSAASRFMFVLANTMRSCEGLATVVVSFILIIQSTTVIELFFNFAAMQFVSGLDNLAYELVMNGYIGDNLQDAAKSVSELSVPSDRKHLRWRRAAFVVTFAAMVAGLSVVHARVSYRVIGSSCLSLEIRFDDAIFDLVDAPLVVDGTSRNQSLFAARVLENSPPSLVYSFFSGNYVTVNHTSSRASNVLMKDLLKDLINDRPVYYERGLEDDPTGGMIYYCEEDTAWVFTIPALKNNFPARTRSRCKHGWLMQSPITYAASLEDAPLDNWSVWTGTVETMSLSVTCNECSRDTDCGLTNGECDDSTRTCKCVKPWNGHHCEKPQSCPDMMWTHLGDSSFDFKRDKPLSRLDYDITTKQVTLTHDDDQALEVNDRPVYHDYGITNETFVSVAFYSGNRWIIGQWDEEKFVDVLGASDFDTFFDSRLLSAYWHLDTLSRELDFLSDPDDSFSPAGVASWNMICPSRSLGASEPFGGFVPVKGRVECIPVFHKTQPDYLCGLYGKRNKTYNMCECEKAFGGAYCEFDPFGPYVSAQATQFVSQYDGNNTGEYVRNAYHQAYWAKYTNEELFKILKSDQKSEL